MARKFGLTFDRAVRGLMVPVLVAASLVVMAPSARAHPNHTGTIDSSGKQIYCAWVFESNERRSSGSSNANGDRWVQCNHGRGSTINSVQIRLRNSSGSLLISPTCQATSMSATVRENEPFVDETGGTFVCFQEIGAAGQPSWTDWNGIQYADLSRSTCGAIDFASGSDLVAESSYCSITSVAVGTDYAGTGHTWEPALDDPIDDDDYGCGCSGRGGSPSATDDPVNIRSGNFWHTFTDLALPGRGPAIAFERTYNSLDTASSGWFGPGWSSTYEMSVGLNGSTAVVKQPNGSRIDFESAAGGTWDGPQRTLTSLVQNPDGTWTFTRRPGTTYGFDSSGRLTSIEDRNGYVTTITRPTASTVVITDPSGRTVTADLVGGRVTTITDSTSFARTVSYAYDGNGDLTDVVDVDGGHWQFTYDTAHHLVTMRSPRFYGDATTVPSPVVTNHYVGSSGRVDWQSDELGRTTSFAYSMSWSLPRKMYTVVTDPSGVATLYAFAYGTLIRETRGYGSAAPSSSALLVRAAHGRDTTGHRRTRVRVHQHVRRLRQHADDARPAGPHDVRVLQHV
jgi:YD repeat-containing protein